MGVRREVIGVINARCHELKQQTAALRGLVPPQQLEALNEAVAVYDTAVDTGSEPLNVLLAEKRLLCKSKQIAFDCMADGHTLAFLRTSDLYALLGNILDNAVAAAEKEPDPARRYIRLEIARRRGLARMSAQAAGGAVGHNPVSILIPCHRVVGSDGSLTGYAGGIERKIKLLALEEAPVEAYFIPKKGTAL